MRSYDNPVTFDGVDLNSVEGLIITKVDPHRLPKRRVTSYDLANFNGSATTSAFYGGRDITISASIRRPSRELLDASISELRRIADPLNKTLRVPMESSYRDFYNVTLNNMSLQDMNGGYVAATLEFNASDLYSYDTVTTELLNALNLTSGDRSYPVTFEGTADQAPIVTYTVDSLTGGTNEDVVLTNPLTGVSVTVNRTWTAGEVLVVDCWNKTVQVDGADAEFTGNFPVWRTGAGHLNYSDGFTERQVDINVVYTKRYR